MIDVSSKKRIVLKLGTSTLTHKTGKLNIRRMTNLVRILSDLHNAGKELLLVSSGAVGMGVGKLNLPERPKDTPSKQAAAAVGQCELMHIYDDMFSKYNVTVAQILLTRATLTNERLPHVQNTIGRLLEMGVIPIVNENDTVAIDELELEIGEKRLPFRYGCCRSGSRSADYPVRHQRTVLRRPPHRCHCTGHSGSPENRCPH